MLVDENRSPAPASRPARRRRASTRLRARGRGHDGDRRLAERACHRPVRGPAGCRRRARRDLPRAPAGDRDRLRRPRDPPRLQEQRPARRDAGPRRGPPRRRPRRQAGRPRRRLGRSSPRRSSTPAPSPTPASRSRPSWHPSRLDTTGITAEVIRGEVIGRNRARSASRASSRRRPHDRVRPARGRLRDPGQRAPRPRLAYDLPAVAAGDARRRGRDAGRGRRQRHRRRARRRGGPGALRRRPNAAPRTCGTDGTVCLCEDVAVKDLEVAIDEGIESAELLKRYTTVTMGPCQGRHVRRPAARRRGAQGPRDRSASRNRHDAAAAGALDHASSRPPPAPSTTSSGTRR